MSISVLHILPSLALGGAERVTIELAHLQRREGLDAQILSLGKQQDFLVAAVKSRDIPLQLCSAGGTRIGRYRCIASHFKRFDVLHIHSPRGLRYIAPIIPFFAGKTIIYTRHGLDPLDSPYWTFIHKMMRPFIDYVTFVTSSGYDVFQQNHHWDENKLRVVTNGVYVPESAAAIPGKPLRFASVGRMVRLKGQPNLLAAVSQLEAHFGEKSAEEFVLKFFGIGPMEAELRQQAGDIGDGLVEFCGEVQDLEAIYSDVDVIVVASESEGLSMVIIEAMARGIPAIGTDVGGNSTLIHEGETGLLVPYGSVEALAEAMLKLLNNTQLITDYGVAAKRLISEQFSLLDTHKAYMQCYLKQEIQE